jgi:hypothetical protein
VNDGAEKSRPIAPHNLMAAPDWFFPAFTIRRILSQAYIVSFVGNETRNGASVAHFSAHKNTSGITPAFTAKALQRTSQVELFVDTGTLLPVAIGYNIHPDNNDSLDIPVEVRFSSYQSVNGMLVPFHIEKYTNSALTTEIQIQAAEFNTGLTASSVDAQ